RRKIFGVWNRDRRAQAPALGDAEATRSAHRRAKTGKLSAADRSPGWSIAQRCAIRERHSRISRALRARSIRLWRRLRGWRTSIAERGAVLAGIRAARECPALPVDPDRLPPAPRRGREGDVVAAGL